MTGNLLQADKLVVRPLKLETDYDQYLETKQRAGLPDPDNDDPDSIRSLLAVCPASILVADTEQRQCAGTIRSSFTTPRLISSVAVHPDCQGQGIGSILMNDLLYRMSRSGLKTSELLLDTEVEVPDLDLERFYGRFDYERSFAALGMVRYEQPEPGGAWEHGSFNDLEPDIDRRRLAAFKHLYWMIKQDIHEEIANFSFPFARAFNFSMYNHSDRRLHDSMIKDTDTGVSSIDMAVQTLAPHGTVLARQADRQTACYEKRWAAIHNWFNRSAPLHFLTLITRPPDADPAEVYINTAGYYVAHDYRTDQLLPLRMDYASGSRWGHMEIVKGLEAEQLLDELVLGARSLGRRFPPHLTEPTYYQISTGKRI